MSKKLFVGGLSWGTTEETLKNVCSEHGTVLSVVIVLDKETRKSRGFGFVEFSSEAEAQATIEKLDGAKVDGRSINLRPAIDNKNNRGRGNRDDRGRGNRDDRGRDTRRREYPNSRSTSPREPRPSFSQNNSKPTQRTTSRPYRERQSKPDEGSSSFPSQDWGGDAWGAEDKWGKDRRRKREGKKKKKQYKKNNSWDDWDE